MKIAFPRLAKELLFILIILYFVLLATQALFHEGFFRTVDDVTTVRIQDMAAELKRGNWTTNFPVRWSNDLSHRFGYPLFLFYSPLVYYAGAILVLFGKLSAIVASKWVYAFPLLVGPFVFYWATRLKLPIIASLIATILFTVFPFRGYDIYYRGGVAESWAMAFIPGLFGGLFLLEKNNKWGGILVTVFLGLTILSHNLSGFMSIGFVLLYALLHRKIVKKTIIFTLLGLGLSSFYLLPSIFYIDLIKVTTTEMNTGRLLGYLSPFANLLEIQFPFNPEKRFSAVFTYLFLISLIISFNKLKELHLSQKLNVLFFGVIGFLVFVSISVPFWFFWKTTLPLTQILQFPWRVLIIISFTLPFFVGLTFSFLKGKIYKIIFCLGIILLSVYFLTAFKPKEYSYFYEYSSAGSGYCSTTTWEDEFLPLWVKKCPQAPPPVEFETYPESKITSIQGNPLSFSATIEADTNIDLIVNKYYFPGWTISSDGIRLPINYTYSDFGIFKTQLPMGKHLIKVVYQKTALMQIADLVSVTSFGFVVFLMFLNTKAYYSKKQNNH